MASSTTKVKKITITAVLAALIAVMTAYICHIPVPIAGGYIHLGDSLIFLAASILPPHFAMVAAAIGGGLADLLTAPMWAIPTIIIKACITIPFSCKGAKLLSKRNIIAPFFAYCISATGYYLANTLVFGSDVAFLVSISTSLIQSGGSAIIYFIFASALDKMNFKKRIL